LRLVEVYLPKLLSDSRRLFSGFERPRLKLQCAARVIMVYKRTLRLLGWNYLLTTHLIDQMLSLQIRQMRARPEGTQDGLGTLGRLQHTTRHQELVRERR
jgi:hypothetical protein